MKAVLADREDGNSQKVRWNINRHLQ
ncbi:hypothetical protein F383_07598 [Gossypium arboreum]|uniref:Uncharacterized protein n=1 Tax=Gossypium arboreum TaxID=29729 RepID=A0A0B0P756_GOSAR|nr:hypothetical protein F383_07598 [Gossypium arboreum]